MATQVQNRRGTTAQHNTFTGASGEITVDTDKKTVVVHDGLTAGGFPLAPNSAFDIANAAFNSANNVAPQVSPAFNTANAAFAAANQAGVVANNANTFADTTYVKKAGDTISGDLVVQGNVTVSGKTTYANTQTLLIGDNIITLNNDLPVDVAPSEDAGIEIKRGTLSNVSILWNEASDKWTLTNDGTNYKLIASNTDVESANNYAGVMANAANSVAASKVASVTGTAGQIYSSGGTTPTLNLITSGVTATTYGGSTQIPVFAVDSYGRLTSASNVAVNGMDYAYVNTVWGVANSKVDTITSNSSTRLWANSVTVGSVETVYLDLATSGVSAGAYSSGISAITVDAYGRVTAVTGSAGYVTSSGVTSVATGTGLTGGTITTTGTISLATAGAGAASYSSGISAITVDAYGRVTSVSGSAGYVTSSGVTSVSGTAGRITSSGGTTPAIDLATSGVAATTYGGATNIPAITVDSYGRITSASNVAVSSGGLTIGNETASSSTLYPIFTSNTGGGSISSANVDTTDLYFVPSTGTLSAKVFTSLSDLNYKTNIQEFDGNSLIQEIRPVTFNWKENGNKSYGFIAQELEKVLPELVETNEEGIKSVAYTPVIAILLSVVKNQEDRIKKLEEMINAQ